MAIAPSALTPPGLAAALDAAGIVFHVEPSGTRFATVAMETAAQTIINTYTGSASQLAWTKAQKQAALDALFDTSFDLARFVRGGIVSTVTSSTFSTNLVAIANNYRAKRAAIAAALTVAAVNAIDHTAGWPANP